MRDLVRRVQHCVETAVVHIKADEPVREEDGRDFAAICEICEICEISVILMIFWVVDTSSDRLREG